MLASITPLGERGRGRSWRRTVTAYLVGSALGGTALGAVLATLAAAFAFIAPDLRWILAAALSALLVVLDLRRRLPSWPRQVDARWVGEFRGWVVGLGFGAQLGAALVTIVPSAATWVMVVVAVASGSPGAALSIGVTFGIVRALPVLAMARVSTPQGLRALHTRVAALAQPVGFAAQAMTGIAVLGLAMLAVAEAAA
jgi:MFS family permease